MGWTYELSKLTDETPAQRIAKDLTSETETVKSTVIATATAGNVVYAAVRDEIKNSKTSYVYCAVVLFSNSEKNGFGTKFMDETMGPCAVNCSNRIMKLLSPVAEIPGAGYAAEWRANVQAARNRRNNSDNNVRSLNPGDVVRLKNPVNFFAGGPSNIDTFRVIERLRRTLIFTPLDRPNFRCRLTRSALEGATIERAQASTAANAQPIASKPTRIGT
jgi:hypothetical protein